MIQTLGGIQIALVIALALPATAQVETHDTPPSPADQYQALLGAFQEVSQIHFKPTTTEEERKQSVARADESTVEMLALVEKHPREAFALEALTQVVTQEYWLNAHTSHPGWGRESPQARAITLLLRDHLQSDQLVETCKRVNFGFRPECETFLRTVLAGSPHRDVRGAACLRLAQFLAGRVEKLALLEDQPAMARRYEGLFGIDYLESLRRRDPTRLMGEAELFYEKAINEYGEVMLPYNETVGEVAGTDLFEIRHLTVGKTAPELEGTDQEGRTLRLSDYRGKVVLLYFWSEF